MNDPVENSLEEKFNAALSSVRPLHLSLLTYEDEQLSRLWILKLKKSQDGDLRVQFMQELAKQIRSKKLSPPFNKYPPEGKSLRHIRNMDFGDTLEFEEDSTTVLSTEMLDAQSNFAVNFTTEDEEFDYNRHQNPKSKSIFTSFQHREPIDCNTVSFLKNDALLHEVNIYQKASKRNEKKMECVSREVEDLKLKLQDLQRINKTIEENHTEVINDYKAALIETTDELTSRLETLTRKNEEIGIALVNLKNKYREPSPLRKKAYMELVAVTRKLSNELRKERAKRKAEVEDLRAILADKDHQIEKLKRRLASLDEVPKRDQSPTNHCRMLMERVCQLQTHIDKMSKASIMVQQKMKQEDRKHTEDIPTRPRSPRSPERTVEPLSSQDKKHVKLNHDIHEFHDKDAQVEVQKRKSRGAEEKICSCHSKRK